MLRYAAFRGGFSTTEREAGVGDEMEGPSSFAYINKSISSIVRHLSGIIVNPQIYFF